MILKTQISFGQNSFQDSLFNKFRKDIELEQKENSGLILIEYETKISFYSLLAYSTVENLIKYTNDTSAYIRANVYLGLLERDVKQPVLKNILDLHKNDSAKFISKGGCVKTSWRVNELMKFALVNKSKNKSKNINYKERIQQLESQKPIELLLRHISHNIIEKDQLLKSDSLTFSDSNIKIKSFSIYLNEQEFQSRNNYLTEEMKSSIKMSKSGDKIYFENIKVIWNDNIVRQMASSSFKLK
jgi:hypothetical protein